jgi:hypothetical protein
MIRERALKVLLVLSGLACLTGLYPLTGALRDGAATTINRQDQMILGIDVTAHAGGSKHMECRVYVSAFNHTDTDVILRAVGQAPWRDKEVVQVS